MLKRKKLAVLLLTLALTLGLLPAALPEAQAAQAGTRVDNGSALYHALIREQPGTTYFEQDLVVGAPDSLGAGSQEAVITHAAQVLDGNGHSVTLWPDGIILGGDLTLRNMKLVLSANTLPAIVANGYTLTLENVNLTSTFPAYVFCGTILGYEAKSGTKLSVPSMGPKGTVIVQGGSVPHIVGGSTVSYPGTSAVLSPDGLRQDACIQLSGRPDVQEIRTGGMSRNGQVSPSTWVEAPGTHPGSLEIRLDGPFSKKGTIINGLVVAGTPVPVSLHYQGGTAIADTAKPVLTRLTRLVLSSGTLQPAQGSTFTGITPAPSLKLNQGAVLDLTGMKGSESLRSLEGGGALVLRNISGDELGPTQHLTIQTVPTGTTFVAFDGLNRDGDRFVSQEQPIQDSPYLTVLGQAPADRFQALPEVFNSPSYLQYQPVEGGVQWIGSHTEPSQPEPEPTVVKLRSIAPVQETVTVYTHEAENILNVAAQIPLEVVYADGSDWGGLSSIPVSIFDYTLSNDLARTMDPLEGYSWMTTWNYVPHQLSLGLLDDGAEGLWVEAQPVNGVSYPLATGSHKLKLTIPKENTESGKSIGFTVTLNVVDGVRPAPTPPPTGQITAFTVNGSSDQIPTGMLNLSVTTVLTEPERNAGVLAAAYDSRGRLLGMAMELREAGGPEEQTTRLQLPAMEETPAEIKAMLVDGDKWTPLAWSAIPQ